MIIRNETAIVLLIFLIFTMPTFAQNIHEAAWNGDFETVKAMLEENPKLLNAKGPWEWTPLQRAVYFNHVNIISFLVSKGADVNIITPDGETALHWAIKLGHEELSHFFITNDADETIRDNWGTSPLQLAVENGYLEIVETLIEKGVDPHVEASHYGRSLLHLASIHGYYDIAKILIEKGANINTIDDNGNNSLYYAARYGNENIAELLVANGAIGNDKVEYHSSTEYLNKHLKQGEAIIWYLGSCGWAVKTKNYFLIFDYWEYGKKPTEPSLLNGRINPDNLKDLNVHVFVTHSHADHYDPVIYEWENYIDNIEYVFGWKANENPDHIYLVGPRATKKSDDVEIYTINSHHVDVPEVAFLVKVDGLSIYFNGDYNGEIRKDIDYLTTKSAHVDLAFAEGGASVTTYMLERFKPTVWFPMHERGTEFKYKKYEQKITEMKFKTTVVCAENRGDRYFFSNGIIEQW